MVTEILSENLAGSPGPQGTQRLLGVRLFGGFSVTFDGAPAEIPKVPRRWDWLLAYLVMNHARTVSRDEIAGALWPDSAQAKNNLTKSLTVLRSVLAEHAWRVESPRSALRINLEGADVDLLVFDAATKRVAEARTADLNRAVEVYRGDLLEGWTAEWVESDGFHEGRGTRRVKRLEALTELASRASFDGDVESALRYAELVLTHEPYREPAVQAKMRALAARGDYAAAMRAYVALQDELGASPSRPTSDLADEIRELGRRRRPTSAPPATANPRCRLQPGRGLVPCPLTPFVGSEGLTSQVLVELMRTRILTLTGMGGIGKTRLAVAVADELENVHGFPVRFFNLAQIPSFEELAEELAFRLAPDSTGDPLARLLEVIGRTSLVLILDECEQVLEGTVRLVKALLAGCPNLRVLATSRLVLGCAGEREWPVAKLAVPPASVALSESDLRAHGATQLFLARASEVDSSLTISDGDSTVIAEICTRAEGIPLAIELLAAQARTLSLWRIVELVDRGSTR